ncbi:MAG: phosphate signaling complex protein PhoU [bacterium]
MERHFDEQLQALKYQLMKMSALAESMIGDAVKALVERDESVFQIILQRETQVNRLQIEIDEMCLTLIALHQPAAGDLRFIMGAAKTNADLERLADQAVNISDKAADLVKQPPLRPFVIIPEMATIARGMVRDSLHAFVNRDVNKARDVLVRDDQLDERKSRITVELSEFMAKESSTVSRALALILISRNLERIGDHATNIAENTIFVVEGRDIRHHGGH